MKIDGKEVKIIGMVRSKNSGKYLDRLFIQLSKICDKILITDNESTDNTVEICNTYPKVVRFPTFGFNGGRDWRLMWKAAEPFKPDWVIGLDSDELFEDGKEQDILKLMTNSDSGVEAWSFPFLTCWDHENTYNMEGWYGAARVVRLFRYSLNSLPKDTIRHSMCAPEGIKYVEHCDIIRVKHFGYMTAEDRAEKYKHYCDRDRDMIAKGEANYEHFGPQAVVSLKSLDDLHPEIKAQLGRGPDRVGGYTRSENYEKNSVSYAYASDWLEFETEDSYISKLQFVYDVLKEEAKFDLLVPDLRDLCLRFIRTDDYGQKEGILKQMYGGNTMGFDWMNLKRDLERIGFVNVVKREHKKLFVSCNKPTKK